MPSTESLCREIERNLPDRPFTIEFWDGGRVPATKDGSPTLKFRSPRALTQVLRAPGELGLGRAYVLGDIEVDDLDGVISLLGRWSPRDLGVAGKARLGLASLRAAGLHRPPPPPAAELRPSRERHTKGRDSEAVRHHYDVSNEFFSLFLDDSMTYSCALFEEGINTLEEAQFNKLEAICSKLELRPGMSVLDIGSGWGSFGIHAAREHGAQVLGITLSPPQAARANERAAEAGVADLVRFEVRDYRDLGSERFDAVVSIGMVEHVGENQIDEYAHHLQRVLAPEGKILNHGICRVPAEEGGVHIGGDFANRYVFPDGEILNLSRTIVAVERAGLETRHVEGLITDYAETLRHWAQRLDENLEEAERQVGSERLRVWRLYLRAARNGFETGGTVVYQVLCSHPVIEPPTPAPSGRRHATVRRPAPAVTSVS
ncbi:MAG: class I SAM-dependent methyltransferase [Solirubrobacterales bacterium]|nr:class I SAM-dependent methyltransferase [Solirubrobacterales bacterium]